MDAFVTSAASKGKQPAQPQQDNPVAYELPWSVPYIHLSRPSGVAA